MRADRAAALRDDAPDPDAAAAAVVDAHRADAAACTVDSARRYAEARRTFAMALARAPRSA